MKKSIKILSIFFWMFLIVSSAIILNNCNNIDSKKLQGSIEWTSQDPLSIPIELRQSEFDKGNLVVNSSFEEGETLKNDSNIYNFKLKNWTVVSKSKNTEANVEWVTEANNSNKKENHGYKDDEINTGKHSIKITRKLKDASETDSLGEGVLSDFIPVIPGNYEFTYNVKLNKIYGNDIRRGTKLYKAIDIQLYYFDKNKNPVSGKYRYPYFDNYLDNNFKGYTFSNFWNINDLGWAKVNARTYNYPFSEGDVPDNCRYVKIFLGLRGRGTMWVDDVEFKYSRWNFTTKERLAQYFNKEFNKAELIIPKPKEISAITKVKIEDYQNVIILTPSKLSSQINIAVDLLKNKLAAYNKNVKISGSVDNLDKSLIFSIGNTLLFEKNKNKLPLDKIKDKEQGYIVNKLDNIIYMYGKDDILSYYAVTTVLQLFDDKDKVYCGSDIIDYPDFLGRSYVAGYGSGNGANRDVETEIKNIDLMSFWKLNRAYIIYSTKWNRENDEYRKGVKILANKFKETGLINMGIMLNPTSHFPYEPLVADMSDSLRYSFRYGDAKSLDKVKKYFKTGLDAGANFIMLCQDDMIPHRGDYSKIYTLWTDEDDKQFKNLANAQAYMINDVSRWLKSNYKNVRFEFCPPWYLNEFIDKSRGHAEAYFRDLMLQIPEDVVIIWTGNTVRSLEYDIADIERYRELVGKYPMLWDNTLYARGLTGLYGGYPIYYPGKARMCNLFEPYDIKVPKDFYKYNDGRMMYTNGGIDSEFYKLIKYLTVADFEWNSNEYNPDFSLFKALIYQFGREGALKLIDFNDIYYSLVSNCRYLQIEFENKNNSKINKINNYINQANTLIKQLNNNYQELQTLVNKYPKLINDISKTKDAQIKLFNDLLIKQKADNKGLRQI